MDILAIPVFKGKIIVKNRMTQKEVLQFLKKICNIHITSAFIQMHKSSIVLANEGQHIGTSVFSPMTPKHKYYKENIIGGGFRYYDGKAGTVLTFPFKLIITVNHFSDVRGECELVFEENGIQQIQNNTGTVYDHLCKRFVCRDTKRLFGIEFSINIKNSFVTDDPIEWLKNLSTIQIDTKSIPIEAIKYTGFIIPLP